MNLLKKSLLIILGTISLVLGIIGIFLPVLPTVPLLLLTSFCYLKSSEKLNEKFQKVKNGKGVACTISLDSMIGVSMYQLLSNDRTVKEGGKR